MTTLIDFEGIMISEISQMEEEKHCMVPLYVKS